MVPIVAPEATGVKGRRPIRCSTILTAVSLVLGLVVAIVIAVLVPLSSTSIPSIAVVPIISVSLVISLLLLLLLLLALVSAPVHLVLGSLPKHLQLLGAGHLPGRLLVGRGH